MTASPTPAGSLIPAIVPTLHPTRQALPQPKVPLRRPPLPLPDPSPSGPRSRDLRYALTAVDKSGRLAARSVLTALGWPPGTRLQVRERAGQIVVTAAPDGGRSIDERGHLVLPLPVRRRCRLATGEQLLLVADLAAGRLTGYPLAVLDRLLGHVVDAVDGRRS
jgi:hypothetical protein